MGMNVGGGKGIRPDINVTPLVDVVLVLLIIFMVVTPLLSKKFWLHMPKPEEKKPDQPAPPPDPDQSAVVVTLLANGDIKVNQDIVKLDELARRIRRVLAARPDDVVFFDAVNDAEYGDAVAVMDEMKAGGAVIAVLTENLAK